MTIDAIRQKIKDLGVSRDWLASQCEWTKGHVVNLLAPNGSKRSAKSLNRIWRILLQEEQRQASGSATPGQEPVNQIVLQAGSDRFQSWNRAAVSQGATIPEWAAATLDAAAGHPEV